MLPTRYLFLNKQYKAYRQNISNSEFYDQDELNIYITDPFLQSIVNDTWEMFCFKKSKICFSAKRIYRRNIFLSNSNTSHYKLFFAIIGKYNKMRLAESDIHGLLLEYTKQIIEMMTKINVQKHKELMSYDVPLAAFSESQNADIDIVAIIPELPLVLFFEIDDEKIDLNLSAISYTDLRMPMAEVFENAMTVEVSYYPTSGTLFDPKDEEVETDPFDGLLEIDTLSLSSIPIEITEKLIKFKIKSKVTIKTTEKKMLV